MNDYLIPLEDETFEEYRLRVYKMKQSGELKMRWTDIAEMFNEVFNVDRDESTWRKEAKEMLISNVEEFTSDEESLKENLRDLILKLKKEKIKLSDERVQNNAYIRRLAREETIKEIALQVAKEMDSKKLLYRPSDEDCYSFESDERNETILQLSDWHYGIEVNTYWNVFDTNVCRERITRLLEETIKFCEKFNVCKLYIVNLGDLICGRIHQTLRLQSRIDTISQIIEVSEILAEFISELTSKGIYVDYFDCLDNHSRLEPNKADSIDIETLARITPWYLKERLKENENVRIRANQYDDDIISFNIMGYKICGVHGHKDKPGRVVEGLTLMTQENFDLILTAHLHHFSSDEKNEVMVISNGSLMGTDQYAKDLRLSSIPSQNLILVNKNSVADYIHRVILR